MRKLFLNQAFDGVENELTGGAAAPRRGFVEFAV
jgi:hypothetical protein